MIRKSFGKQESAGSSRNQTRIQANVHVIPAPCYLMWVVDQKPDNQLEWSYGHFVHVKLEKPTWIASHLIQSCSSIRAVRNSKFRRRDLESLA